MDRQVKILLVDDEPLILMDLELAAEDLGYECFSAGSVRRALELLDDPRGPVDVAVLDVSLLHGETCVPIAFELDRRCIPYIIHSGDLDRRDETIRSLDAILVAKPAASDKVISTAIVEMNGGEDSSRPLAAE